MLEKAWLLSSKSANPSSRGSNASSLVERQANPLDADTLPMADAAI
jgi:hypothetical protein